MHWARLKEKKVWVGLDGFVDKLVCAVKCRKTPGDQVEVYKTLLELGQRIREASGVNLNIELMPKCEKMGGNGPLLANVLLQMGTQVHYVGTLGDPIHPLFEDFAKNTNAISLGQPGETHALEFEDGKLLLGYTYPMEQVNYENLLKKNDVRTWVDTFSGTDVIAFQNWTMLYGMTDLLQKIVEVWLPSIAVKQERIWFFDLADPAKRTREDLNRLLQILPQLRMRGEVYLALNRGEAKTVGDVLGLPCPEVEAEHMLFQQWLQRLREKIGIDRIVFHCRLGAIAADGKGETVFVPALKAKQLTCLTGSGDHFNGGFLCGCLMNFELAHCLRLGHIVSVLYIESGHTPSYSIVEQCFNQ